MTKLLRRPLFQISAGRQYADPAISSINLRSSKSVWRFSFDAEFRKRENGTLHTHFAGSAGEMIDHTVARHFFYESLSQARVYPLQRRIR